ncbi:Uncharacterised protein [Suttonella ornithocola]|uniref:Uncharacterized protein n=1 Tax=Suttonella ornithocola TaxID=279832 RepID=A0A380MSI6_9GAMM|nr:Uncharacterised protein [Suttonella ornithocola]
MAQINRFNQNPVQPEKPQEPELTVVDPTQNNVVVAFELDKKPSVGELTYIRQKDSKFNINAENQGLNSAATAMVSLPLESQNPHLTNIVLGNLKNTQIAQFAGSNKQNFKDKESLQTENVKYHKDSIQKIVKDYAYLNGRYSGLGDFGNTQGLDKEIKDAIIRN